MKLKEILTGKHSCFLLCALLIFFIGLSVSAEQSIRTIIATGTGFIVSSEGYILTNEHVIHGATKITVTINGQDYKAEVVKADPNKDIALLKVEGHGLPTVRLGDSDTVQITDQVIAIGCPRQICGTVTRGEVANLPSNLIMMDLTLASGSSGGPLLNEKGEVIGINTSVVPFGGSAERSEMPSGFSLAIPINQAIPLLQSVPGFSTSEMGQAQEELSLEEIERQAGAATIFVKAVIEQPLESFLPREALGSRLKVFSGIPNVPSKEPSAALPAGCLFPFLKEAGFEIQKLAMAWPGWEYSGEPRAINIIIYDLENGNEAQNAATFLKDPENFRSPGTCHPSQLKLECSQVQSKALFSDVKSLDGKTLTLAVRFSVRSSSAFGGQFDLDRAITLWGSATFVLNDLVFVIWLVEDEYFSTADPGNLPRAWEHFSCDPRDNYIFCSWGKPQEGTYRTSLSPDKFVEAFNSLINTTIKTISGGD